tara:strand:- start:150214 stop:153048 length:2835 start_codon:yes stop_codon:yes gene_type:complete
MGKYWIKHTAVLVLLIIAFVGHAQSSAISGNGKQLIHLEQTSKDKVSGQYKFTSSLYGRAQKTLLKRFEISSNTSSYPEEILLNHNGKMVYLAWKNDYRVYNALTGVLLFRFKTPVKVAMSHNDNFFVVSTELWIKAYDAYTGEELHNYQTAPINYVRKMQLTENDEHLFAVTDRKQILVWEIDREKPRKKYYSDDVSISNNTFTLKRVSGTSVSIYQYSLPEFKRVEKLSVNKMLRDYAKEQTVEYRKKHPKDSRAIIRPSEILNKSVFLNQSGDKFSIFVETPEEQKGIIVANLSDGKILLDEVVGELKSEFQQEWYNDSLLIPSKDEAPKVFNANKREFEKSLDYFIRNGSAKSFNNQKLLVTPNFKFSVEIDGDNLVVRKERSEKRLDLNGYRFLGFSSNSKTAFFENISNGKRGYYDLVGFGKTGSYIKYFGEKEYPNLEELLPEPKQPAGYVNQKINGYKHISKAGPNDTLKIVMKSLVAGEEAGMQLQVMDQNGVYYYGAGDPKWRKFWCNLMVKGSDGKVRQIDDFKVTEHRSYDTIPNAISLVVDFSGSMGWPRADALQDGIERFISSKKEVDKISLFKYDHHIVKECDPTTNENKLIRRLFRSDFSEFGGSTALLDAIDAGIHSVKSVRNVSKKIVIVFTDGIENSSLATRNEVIGRALKYGVSIYTVAFGDLVDRNFLKSVAYNTRGGFYQSFNVSDFEWLFKDIYTKAENYYSVKYDTFDKGSQVQVIKICKDNLTTSDSLAIEFKNDPKDVEMLLENDNLYVDNPVKYEGKDYSSNEFYHYNREASNMAFIDPKGVEVFEIDDDRISKIEDDFEKVDLPTFNFKYDKTNTVQDTEARIQQLIDFTKKYPDVSLMISGHTDNMGTIAYNDKLSLNRAIMVKDMLIGRGVNGDKLFTEGIGELSPIATNATAEGRAKNRRVEFRILSEKELRK